MTLLVIAAARCPRPQEGKQADNTNKKHGVLRRIFRRKAVVAVEAAAEAAAADASSSADDVDAALNARVHAVVGVKGMPLKKETSAFLEDCLEGEEDCQLPVKA